MLLNCVQSVLSKQHNLIFYSRYQLLMKNVTGIVCSYLAPVVIVGCVGILVGISLILVGCMELRGGKDCLSRGVAWLCKL